MGGRDRYLETLAELQSRVRSAEPGDAVVIEGAAGLLAGRIGGRVDQARARILQLAAEQQRPVRDVAAEMRTVLQELNGAGEPDDEAHLVQQMLDAGVGRHLFLVPLRGAHGDIEDYRIAAASPSAVDVTGRSGAQLLGRSVAELYPPLTGGPVWQAWREAVADGRPREVGPVPYQADAGTHQLALTYTIRAHPVGHGLLASWTRQDEESRLAGRLSQTERLGHLGWGEWDLVNDAVVWSDGMYRIFERDPADGPLARGTVEKWTVPADLPLLEQAAHAFGRGEPVDVQTRVRIGGRVKHLRTVADAVRDGNGRPLKVYGIVQDVTAQETGRARLTDVEERLREHQRSLAAENRLAARLQHIILPIPAEPVDLPGLQVAVRYLPAERASRVGGDWFHAAPVRDGSVLLAVGDVSGHGVYAATTMAQLRHALAALAVTITADPAALLGHLNDLLYSGGLSAPTATLVVARFDPATAVLQWAQGGHPAPLCSRDGTTTRLPRPDGPLLGAMRDARYDTATIRVAEGDVLLFYTDGLIEHRHRPLLDGLTPVIGTLNRITAGPRPQPLADLLADLHQANPDDDTCLLAVRRIEPAGPA